MIRVLRTPLISLGFASLALLFSLSQSAFAAPGDILFSDDFERNNLAPVWTRSNNQRAGISTQTANSGTRSLFTCCGAVDVTSSAINLSAVPAAELSVWIHVGDDTISEFPDSAGEDLIIQYLDSTATWVILETFIGGTGGVELTGNIYNRTYTLPTNAMHANFQIRISQNGGSGTNWDYYHVDDVVVTEISPPPPFGFGGCDNFETGLTYWTVSATTGNAAVRAGVDTVNSPTNALYLANGRVYVTSTVIDTSTATAPTLTLWVRRGQDGLDGYSENPDPNEDLQIQYLDSGNNWITLDTLPGGGTPGEILNLSYALPANAVHANFRLRFYQTNGSGVGWDYWHVDDVCVTEPPPPPVCEAFLDMFSTVSYANNDGTVSWAGNWSETGDDSSPNSGTIQISNNRLQLEGNGNGGSATFGGPSIEREADLSPYTTATLTFDYSESGNWEANDNIDVYVSNNGGGNWTLLHNFNNDQGAAVQTLTVDVTSYISNNFRLAFVERANQASEIFYIDNVQVEACAPPSTQPDHYRIVHDGSGLTCSPESIIVRACLDNTCSSEYSGSITATLAPSTWVGGNTQTFTSGSTLQLWHTTAETTTLDITSTSVAATNPIRCFVAGVEQANCDMVFYDSGFVFDVPNHTAATTQTVQISAVRADPMNPEQCIPGFQSVTKSVGFWSSYSNPATGSAAVNINGTNIGNTSPGTAFDLNFDAGGQATFDLSYADVGQIQLDALHSVSASSGTSDAGLVMSGNDLFVSRPAGFTLSNITRISNGAANPAAADSNGSVFIPAGEPFSVTISSVNAIGAVTPNFGQESPAERVKLSNATSPDLTGLAELVAPAGGNNAILGTPVWQPNTAYVVNQMVQDSGVVYQATNSGTSGATFGTGSVTWANLGSPLIPASGIFNTSGVFSNGIATGTYAWPEVGIINFTARVLDADYLGAGDVVGNSSGNVGRFIPARLFFSGNVPVFNNTCVAGVNPFTYLSRDFDFATNPIITVTAQSTLGGFTRNYGGGFWKLHPGTELTNRSYSNTAATAATFTDTIAGAATLAGDSDFNATPPTLTIAGDTLNYSRPAAPEPAFAALVNLDLTAADLTDNDGVCFDSTSTTCNTSDSLGTATGLTISNITGANMRYGIGIATDTVESATAIGTTLTLPITAQYVDAGGTVVTNTDDMCSVISYTKADTGITTTAAPASPTTFNSGSADLTVTLNSDTGGDIGGYSVFTLTWPTWLPGPPNAAAIFGAVPSDNNYLYWNENR